MSVKMIGGARNLVSFTLPADLHGDDAPRGRVLRLERNRPLGEDLAKHGARV